MAKVAATVAVRTAKKPMPTSFERRRRVMIVDAELSFVRFHVERIEQAVRRLTGRVAAG